MKQDNETVFSVIERDAIGEILNISIGSSATAVSNMLQKRTEITTPTVDVVSAEEFEITAMEPAIGVEIEYVEGLRGKNIFVLKKKDIRSIVETLLQMEIPEEEFELNELNMSAVCEVMNQMMGAASTALASLLGSAVDISPPNAYEVDDIDDLKSRYFLDDDVVVVVRFNLMIEDILDSEFLSVMPIKLAKEVVSALGIDSTMAEPEPAPAPVQEAPPVQPAPTPAPVPMQEQAPPMQQPPQMQEPIPMQQPPMQQQPMQEMPPQQYGQPYDQSQQYAQQSQYPQQQQYQQQPQYGQPMMPQQMPPQQYMAQQSMPMQPQYMQPRMIQVQTPPSEGLNAAALNISESEGKNLDMLMSVPLEISVEIGRARKPIKEIVAFTQGTLVVLDKMAGEQVDLYVNNQCIAKGDVVVVDDSFGIRITKILDKNDIFNIK